MFTGLHGWNTKREGEKLERRSVRLAGAGAQVTIMSYGF
jgi:hypothetical protein